MCYSLSGQRIKCRSQSDKNIVAKLHGLNPSPMYTNARFVVE